MEMGYLPAKTRGRKKFRLPYGVYTCRICGFHPLMLGRLPGLRFGQPVRDGGSLSGVADESRTDSRCVPALAFATRHVVSQPVGARTGRGSGADFLRVARRFGPACPGAR